MDEYTRAKIYDSGNTREVVDDQGDLHIIWTGKSTNGSRPYVILHGNSYTVRREVWKGRHPGEELPDQVMVGCGIKMCIEHVEERTQAPSHRRQYYAWYRKEYAENGPLRVDAQPVRDYINKHLFAVGMSAEAIAAEAGISRSTVTRLSVPGLQHKTDRVIAARILGITPSAPPPRSYRNGHAIDPCGVKRRIEALLADGFDIRWIHDNFLGELGSKQNVHRLLYGRGAGTNQRGFRPITVQRVKEMYEKLDGRTPDEFLLEGWRIARNKERAWSKGYAPRHCWDDDTIDDPKAIAEYTGACGTRVGYDIHRRTPELPDVWSAPEGKPLQQRVACGPCLKAATGHQVSVRAKLRERAANGDYAPRYGKMRGHEAEIVARYQGGETMSSIAESFGVHRVSIGMLLKKINEGDAFAKEKAGSK